MNSFIVFFLLFLHALPTANDNEVIVVVEGVKNNEGAVMVGLFDNAKDFLERPRVGKVVSINSGKAEAVFRDLPQGVYGISVIHDENNNGELDTNGIGIPKEGFAFGNNAMGMFGPPSFRKASVNVNTGSVKQTLRMRYF